MTNQGWLQDARIDASVLHTVGIDQPIGHSECQIDGWKYSPQNSGLTLTPDEVVCDASSV